jgi:hypothetical protein
MRLCVWPRSGGSPGGKPDCAEESSTVVATTTPESLEGALVAQLVWGQIAARQYARAMEKLAARDDHQHPLAVPPETARARRSRHGAGPPAWRSMVRRRRLTSRSRRPRHPRFPLSRRWACFQRGALAEGRTGPMVPSAQREPSPGPGPKHLLRTAAPGVRSGHERRHQRPRTAQALRPNGGAGRVGLGGPRRRGARLPGPEWSAWQDGTRTVIPWQCPTSEPGPVGVRSHPPATRDLRL